MLSWCCRYWCTKCKKRFGSQAKLVDHMSYSLEHNYKQEGKKRNGSSSMTPSPASSDSSLSSPSPGSVSPFNDIMSVLSPS